MEKNSKKWSMVNYIFLWIGVCFSIPTFMVTETLWKVCFCSKCSE